jgi:hypothetical protein
MRIQDCIQFGRRWSTIALILRNAAVGGPWLEAKSSSFNALAEWHGECIPCSDLKG